ncbi:MAG: SDR family oxidoreductase [Planctomycetes bacterium]|nr:SDR family oxidoreductase [Planctomycetota bacterium]
MTRYLITGGAGFIGSAIAERLVRDGHRVRVLDDFSTGMEERLVPIADDVEIVRGDVRDRDAVERCLRGVEVVFHEAALPSVARSVEDPLTSHDVNVNGTLTLLDAARRAGVRRLVYAASSSAYGDSAVLPKKESQPAAPLSPYAVGKLTGEYYCRIWWTLFGLPTVSLRYFNVFGPRQDPRSEYAAVIPRFVTAALSGRAAQVFGDGEQTRDFTFVDNVVDANLLAAQATGAEGGVFNIACGERISLNRLLREIGEITGKPVQAEYGPPRPGDVMHSLADISRARDILGFEPRVSVREGLDRTVAWFRVCETV